MDATKIDRRKNGRDLLDGARLGAARAGLGVAAPEAEVVHRRQICPPTGKSCQPTEKICRPAESHRGLRRWTL